MITKQKVLKVIASLKTVEKMANKSGAFDMMESTVRMNKEGHPCGTIHCLAGLYAVANYKGRYIQAKLREHNYIDYLNGAELMATDLGFYNINDLREWLAYHEKEWGNCSGSDVFKREEAFNYPGFSGVIQHFEDFAGRLEAA